MVQKLSDAVVFGEGFDVISLDTFGVLVEFKKRLPTDLLLMKSV